LPACPAAGATLAGRAHARPVEWAAVDPVLEAMVEAARAGGRVARAHFERGTLEAEVKPVGSPVTRADREAETAIIERLARAFPDHGMLGEETGPRGSDRRRFIIDPVDGTRNFVRGIPHWATLLALEEDGVVTAGVVHVPVAGQLYTARLGGGAYRDGERLAVSTIATLRQATLLHPSLPMLRRLGRWDGFIRLVDATDRQRGFGDFLSYVLVAEGKAEIALGLNVKPWDLAPIRLLLEEAGGRFTDLDGIATIASGTAFGTNGRLHAAALALLRGAGG
jgi:histidinol-phosphatase